MSLSLSYPRLSAFIGGQIAFFSTLLAVQDGVQFANKVLIA
jgi:hypothetical protein